MTRLFLVTFAVALAAAAWFALSTERVRRSVGSAPPLDHISDASRARLEHVLETSGREGD